MTENMEKILVALLIVALFIVGMYLTIALVSI